MSRRSRERKKSLCGPVFSELLAAARLFLCLVDIDVLSSFSRVMFPNRSTWRTIRSLCFASGPHNPKNFVVRKISGLLGEPSRPPRWRLSLSPLFNIFLITVKIDFQSCLPSQQLVLSWGVLSLSYVHTYAIVVVTDSKICSFVFLRVVSIALPAVWNTKSSNGIITMILFEAQKISFCAEN